MQIDWTASKVACGLDDKATRRELAKLILSLDDPMPYSNADVEIKGAIFEVLKRAAAAGTTHLKKQYGDII